MASASAAAAAASSPRAPFMSGLKVLPLRHDLIRNRVLLADRAAGGAISQDDLLKGARASANIEVEVMKLNGYVNQPTPETVATFTKSEKLRAKRHRQKHQKKLTQQMQLFAREEAQTEGAQVPYDPDKEEKKKEEQPATAAAPNKDEPTARERDLRIALETEQARRLEEQERRQQIALNYVKKQQQYLENRFEYDVQAEMNRIKDIPAADLMKFYENGMAGMKCPDPKALVRSVAEMHIAQRNEVEVANLHTRYVHHPTNRSTRARVNKEQERLIHTHDNLNALSPDDQLAFVPMQLDSAPTYMSKMSPEQHAQAIRVHQEVEKQDMASMNDGQRAAYEYVRSHEMTIQREWRQQFPDPAYHVVRRKERVDWFVRAVRAHSGKWFEHAYASYVHGLPVRNMQNGALAYDQATKKQQREKPCARAATLILCPDESTLSARNKWELGHAFHMEVTLDQLEQYMQKTDSFPYLTHFFALQQGGLPAPDFFAQLLDHLRTYDPCTTFVYSLHVRSIPLTWIQNSALPMFTSRHSILTSGVCHKDAWEKERKDPLWLEGVSGKPAEVKICGSEQCHAYFWSQQESQVDLLSCSLCPLHNFCSPKCKLYHKTTHHVEHYLREKEKHEQEVLKKRVKARTKALLAEAYDLKFNPESIPQKASANAELITRENRIKDSNQPFKWTGGDKTEEVVDEKDGTVRRVYTAEYEAMRERRYKHYKDTHVDRNARRDAAKEAVKIRAAKHLDVINAQLDKRQASLGANKMNAIEYNNMHGRMIQFYKDNAGDDVMEDFFNDLCEPSHDRPEVVMLTFHNRKTHAIHIVNTTYIEDLATVSLRIRRELVKTLKKTKNNRDAFVRDGVVLLDGPFTTNECTRATLHLLLQKTPIEPSKLGYMVDDVQALMVWLECPAKVREMQEARAPGVPVVVEDEAEEERKEADQLP